MGIKERISETEKIQALQERERQQRIEQAIATHPDRLKCQKIIPVIEPIARELAKATKLYLQSDSSERYGYMSERPLLVYSFMTKRYGFWSPKLSGHAFSVYIGAVNIEKKYSGEVQVKVIPLRGWSYTMSRHEDYVPTHDFSSIPEEPNQMKEMLTTFLFNLYQHAKSWGHTK